MNKIASPIANTVRGLGTYVEGVKWLKSHPLNLIILFIPMFLGLLSLMIGWNIFIGYEDTIFQWAMFDKPESWWRIGVFYLAKLFLYVAFVLLGLVGCLLVMNIVASPIYEYTSMVVEADLTGKPAPELSVLDSMKLIGEELKKVLFILCVSFALLLIPGLNVISLPVTAFLVGWDFYDFSLARRGWGFRQRAKFAGTDFWAIMGLGFWLIIPFMQFIFIPLAVVGGTMLSVKALQKNHIKGKGLANANK